MTDTPALKPLDNPSDFLKLGLKIAKSDKPQLAVALVNSVLAHHDNAQPWASIASYIMLYTVPEFHGFMLRDTARNRAYREAIERHAKDRVVLDIGTGSGLLAMMAARAGAAKVYACEANPMLAASATEVIAANGLSDTIKVYAKHSTELDAEADLGGGVDLVVSEVFSDDLLGEGVLKALDHARRKLCRPGALFLPESASIMVGLAKFPAPPDRPFTIEGLDVSRFDLHMDESGRAGAADQTLELRSAPAELFAFDFMGEMSPAKTGQSEVTFELTDSDVTGLAHWIRLQFAPDISYENRPGGDASLHWQIGLVPASPELLARAKTVRARGWYSDAVLAVWCEGPDG